RGRRGDHRGRQYRRLHPHHDDRHRARDIEGRSPARAWARPGADRDRCRRERAGMGRTPRRRATGRMTMRAPLTDRPIMLGDAAVGGGLLTILNDIALTLAAGAPTVLVGPNGSGKTTLLRLAMGLLAPSRGQVTWGGRTDALPTTRRAIVFQRPVMLRRSAA